MDLMRMEKEWLVDKIKELSIENAKLRVDAEYWQALAMGDDETVARIEAEEEERLKNEH